MTHTVKNWLAATVVAVKAGQRSSDKLKIRARDQPRRLTLWTAQFSVLRLKRFRVIDMGAGEVMDQAIATVPRTATLLTSVTPGRKRATIGTDQNSIDEVLAQHTNGFPLHEHIVIATVHEPKLLRINAGCQVVFREQTLAWILDLACVNPQRAVDLLLRVNRQHHEAACLSWKTCTNHQVSAWQVLGAFDHHGQTQSRYVNRTAVEPTDFARSLIQSNRNDVEAALHCLWGRRCSMCRDLGRGSSTIGRSGAVWSGCFVGKMHFVNLSNFEIARRSDLPPLSGAVCDLADRCGTWRHCKWVDIGVGNVG